MATRDVQKPVECHSVQCPVVPCEKMLRSRGVDRAANNRATAIEVPGSRRAVQGDRRSGRRNVVREPADEIHRAAATNKPGRVHHSIHETSIRWRERTAQVQSPARDVEHPRVIPRQVSGIRDEG